MRWSEVLEGTRCWKGYKRKGFKTMFGKRVPNCVKREDVQLGADGQLIFAEDLDENFIVMNGDLLTSLDYKAAFNSHIENNADATIATFERTLDIDFGVIEVNNDSELVDYREKPTSSYKVSMGVNVFRKSSLIPILDKHEYLDIPDVMIKLTQEGKKVFCYEEECSWLDIGRIDDYQEAVDIFERDKAIYLP